MKGKKRMPEDFLEDKLDGMYLEHGRENLFEDEEEDAGGELYEEDETVEEMCGKIGVDADVLQSVVEKSIMPQVIEDARLLTARRAMQEFEDGSWEKSRLKALEGDGFELAEAVERVKHEQLLKRIKMLEKQLENRKSTTGSAYSRAKMEFDD